MGLSLCEPIVSTRFGTPTHRIDQVHTVSTPFDESRGPPHAKRRPVTDIPVTKCVKATSRRSWMAHLDIVRQSLFLEYLADFFLRRVRLNLRVLSFVYSLYN